MKNGILDGIIEFTIKYILIISLILGGALTNALMLNNVKKLTWIQNAAVVLSGCITGGAYAYMAVSWNNKLYLMFSGVVSLSGYNICNFIIATTKDPAKMKEMLIGTLKKIVDSL